MSSSRLLVNTVIRRSYSTAPASTASIEDLLLKLAIPLVRESGWTTATLSRASLLLPHPHTPTTSYSIATLQGLFPSPPAKPRPHSLTREELLRDARGEFDGKEAEDRERCGPGQALFEAWLKEGRSATIRAMKSDSGVKGHEAVRRGLKSRISFNHTMGILDDLPEVSPNFDGVPIRKLTSISESSKGLALLSASTSIAPIPTLSLPSPTPYLEHVASIAHDITQASGSEAQGVRFRSRSSVRCDVTSF